MAKTTKTVKTTKQSPIKEISRTTKHAAKAPAVKETAKEGKVTKTKEHRDHLGFRVYMLNQKSWEGAKALAQQQDTNTHAIIDQCITENLGEIVEAIKKVGIKTGDKRVRMERPAQWEKLLVASSEVGLPAQTLLVMCMAKTFSK